MKLKAIFTIITIIFLATICTGCIDPTLPVYEMTKTEEDGICVTIDGVKYKQLPAIKWNVYNYGKTFGYAGNRDLSVHNIEGDTERDFIFLHGFWDEMYVLYREDIPEPSAENIDELIWVESVIGSDEGYSNTIVAKEIIKELFNILNNSEKITEYNMIENESGLVDISITCKSSEIPGARYGLYIGASNGKLICGDKREKEYVEIPMHLAEKIAGKQIDARQALPVYEREYEGGISVIIDGVRYSDWPFSRWKVDLNDGIKIGYAGISRIFVMVNPEDTKRDFLYIKDYSTDRYYDNWILHRTDKEFPEVDVESVDKIIWEDSLAGNTYTNIVEDKIVIKRLFNILDTWGIDREHVDENPLTNISIKLFCSDLPGAFFPLNLGMYDSKIICEDPVMSYAVYLPTDLLETIAGKKLGEILD